ncbi:DUF397 domain-containing protein [Streptomyces sp. NPDC001544]|uniref:DUF397 domain-containing protein n=1 Tax=Streptomyces sp. NPDC001544 TaxID=3364584 RepID=UPI0036886509
MTVDPQTVSEPLWFKSSYSGGNATECLETAVVQANVLIRDSKRAEGPYIAVSAVAWSRFLSASVK